MRRVPLVNRFAALLVAALLPLAHASAAEAVSEGLAVKPEVSAPKHVSTSRFAQELGLIRLRIHPYRCALSFDWLEEAAQSGDPHVQVELALVLADPEGATVDPQRARQVVWRAAHDGHGFAQTTLGVFYQHAIGGDQNFERARHWFEKAVAQGEVIALQFLAQLYLNGGGGPSRPNAALRLLRKSANYGVAQSQYYLGRYYHQHNVDGLHLPHGEIDLVQAYKWSSLAVESSGDFLTDMGAKSVVKKLQEKMTEEQKSRSERLTAEFAPRLWESSWWQSACVEQEDNRG